MKYLICYDIVNNKKRKILSDLLEEYGYRVNYSVFECELNERQLKKFLTKIKKEKYIDKKYDSLRFYHICKNCCNKSFKLGNKDDIFESKEFFI